ncbi:class I SAM-dependent methyltransferase [Brachyspira innocens]|uniref:class I SAM-dependent methyltransferase n=1 Tax=Brachyspira innocens TaxID=13264 RepID=UPI0003662599|nr:class I SAM-dependent methyltransferase [Brachyspira innocens]
MSNLMEKIFSIKEYQYKKDITLFGFKITINKDPLINLDNIDLLYKLLLQEQYKYTDNNMSLEDYTKMQKNFYENKDIPSEVIVGNYQWHENYPYETFLLYEYGDIRKPIFDDFSNKIALDFACGPGRMINRMKKIFKKVNGCDIAQRLLDEAKQLNPKSEFYLTSGDNLGNVENDYYDFIYCTISMHHIACHSIRQNIVKNIHKALKKNGKITLQLAYNKDVPYTKENKLFINDKLVIVKEKIPMADYLSDDSSAMYTNGGFDVGIGLKDLDNLKKDFIEIFGNCHIWFSQVSHYYDDLLSAQHYKECWATDWIYIHCVKD